MLILLWAVVVGLERLCFESNNAGIYRGVPRYTKRLVEFVVVRTAREITIDGIEVERL